MINDINVNQLKIRRFILNSTEKRKMKNTGYTTEQIGQLLDFCDERTKAIVLIYASTGMRLGALPELRIGDLELINCDRDTGSENISSSSNNDKFQLYQITVYSGYNEEYITFCTPEATKAINSYLDYRKRFGEKLTNDSPLIREQFNSGDSFQSKYNKNKDTVRRKQITIQTIAKTLRLKLLQAGVRTAITTGDYTGARMKNRKEVPLIHGFRKFFNTALMNADVHPVIKELLMGHSIKLDDFYYDIKATHSRQKLLNEYIKAIDNLTISEENRLRIKVQRLTIRADQLMEMRYELDKINKKLKMND